MTHEFSHFDEEGRACMVDIGEKELASRSASAVGTLRVNPETIRMLSGGSLPKGNPLEVARLAGIQAAKRTPELVPLCHNLNLDFVDVRIEVGESAFHLRSEARCRSATGVEMEALTAVAVAALTLYDMCKAVDKTMAIEGIRLESKSKKPLTGRSAPR